MNITRQEAKTLHYEAEILSEEQHENLLERLDVAMFEDLNEKDFDRAMGIIEDMKEDIYEYEARAEDEITKGE